MIGNDWDFFLKEEYKKKYFVDLKKFLQKEYKTKNIFPKKTDIFKALKLVNPSCCKVLILGQDPYYKKDQADGLCFSVPNNIKTPPSLLNILKESENDLSITQPKSKSDLKKWANQGVLLLNSSLTVEENCPTSHMKIGWQFLTDKIIGILNKKQKPMVFILWGAFAQKKEELITNKKHLILKAPHPSPLSAFRGFFGCKHFSKTNIFLKKTNNSLIDWKL